MKIFSYILYRVTIFLFRITPFFVLHVFSSIAGFLLYYVLGYRKNVVFENLKRCFPEKSEKEITNLAKGFYKHLGDILLESVKGYTLSKDEILRRYKILNPDVMNSFFVQKKTVICLASHYGNWEWGMLSVGMQLRHSMISLYKPLSNSYVEKHINGMRKRFQMDLVSIYETRQSFESEKLSPKAYIMAADQNPPNVEKAIWVDFMGIETSCLHGAEYYAKKYNMPVVFFDVRKPERGFYTLEIKVISENPNEENQNAITARYMKMLEGILKEKPEYWLWSHKRWKNFRTK